MEYQVPQFIEVEDKVVGPLSLKQFLYVGGGVGLCAIFFVYLNFVLALLLSVLIGGLALALAFYKVNGKPFLDVLEAGFNYYTGGKLFLWKKEAPKKNVPMQQAAPMPEKRDIPKLTRGKLSDLAWSLDVSGKDRNPMA